MDRKREEEKKLLINRRLIAYLGGSAASYRFLSREANLVSAGIEGELESKFYVLLFLLSRFGLQIRHLCCHRQFLRWCTRYVFSLNARASSKLR